MTAQLRDADFRYELDAMPAGEFQRLRSLVAEDVGFEPSPSSLKVRRRKGL